MPAPKLTLLKKRDTGVILNDTTEFVTKNYGKYSIAFLYFVMPPMLLVMIAITYLFNNISHLSSVIGGIQPGPMALFKIMGSFITTGFIIFFLMMIVILIQSSLALQYVLLYEKSEDPSTLSTEQIWSAIRDNIGTMITSFLGLFFLGFLIIGGLGIFLFFVMKSIPALGFLLIFILLFVYFYIAFPMSNFLIVRLREGLGIFDSIARCFRLSRGRWWSTFGVVFLVSIIVSILQQICVAPLTIMYTVSMLHTVAAGHPNPLAIYTPLYGITQAVSMAVGMYFSGILTFATSINYYSLVEKTDNTSLQQEIEAIGTKKENLHTQEGEF